MKQMIRAVTVVLLVGGWSLATASLHVIRTPSSIAIVPKDRLTFHSTWVDTRKWTLADDQAHAAVVARLVHLGRADLLANTLPPGTSPAEASATLEAIAASQPTPGVATSAAAETAANKVEGQVKTVVNLAKTGAGKI